MKGREDTGSDQGSQSLAIFLMQNQEFADGSDVGCERTGGAKDEYKVLA